MTPDLYALAIFDAKQRQLAAEIRWRLLVAELIDSDIEIDDLVIELEQLKRVRRGLSRT